MNPFVLGYVKPEEKLCDRETEVKELLQHARNATHVVMISSRRLGKTSLVWRVLDDLNKEGFLPIYVDLLSVTSRDNFIEKVASSVTKSIGRSLSPETFFKTIRNFFTRIIPSVDFKPEGISVSASFDTSVKADLLIGDIFDSLEQYLKKHKKQCLLVFDEFQEITELPESKEIEGLLREKLQASRTISCFFVGSRRRVLQEMFTDKRRPFYKMTMSFVLSKIEKKFLAEYVAQRFRDTKKHCSSTLAEKVYDEVEGHTYYVQKLSHIVWDKTEKTATEDIIKESLRELLEAESSDFQGIWTGLGWTEKRVLMGLALDPTSKPYSTAFLSRHGLSGGATQKALKQLIQKDIIELSESSVYQPTDPLIKRWCRAISSGSGLQR